MAASSKDRLTNSQYHHLKTEIGQARDRCLTISVNEMLLGYSDTSLTYENMAAEFSELVNWLIQFMPESPDPLNQK